MSESGSSIVSSAASHSDWSDSDVQEVEEVADSEAIDILVLLTPHV